MQKKMCCGKCVQSSESARQGGKSRAVVPHEEVSWEQTVRVVEDLYI